MVRKDYLEDWETRELFGDDYTEKGEKVRVYLEDGLSFNEDT